MELLDICKWYGQVRDIKFRLDSESKKLSIAQPPKRLIITTGDTSDVDGFLALAEYSKVPVLLTTLQSYEIIWHNSESLLILLI